MDTRHARKYPTSPDPKLESFKVAVQSAHDDPLFRVGLRLLQRWRDKLHRAPNSGYTATFQQAVIDHETFEEALLYLLGLKVSDWAPLGPVVYMAVSSQSINHKQPFQGMLERLGLGSFNDPDFNMPTHLTDHQMAVLYEYANALLDPAYDLEWSCWFPMGWVPKTKAGAMSAAHINNLDVDQAVDNKDRGCSSPSLGVMMCPVEQRLRRLIKFAVPAYGSLCQCSLQDFKGLMRFISTAPSWMNWTLQPTSDTVYAFTSPPEATHTPETLLQHVFGCDMKTLDSYRMHCATVVDKLPGYHLAANKCGE